MEHFYALSVSLVAFLGIFLQWIAWTLRIPSIVLLLAGGILLGPVFQIFDPVEVLGDLFNPIIELAVSIIVFEGGLNLKFHDLKKFYRDFLSLLTIGLLIHLLLGSFAIHAIAGLPWDISILLASLLVITGPTVIKPLLRQAHLKADLSRLITWEGIINDPIGVILVTIVLHFLMYWRGIIEASTLAFDIFKIALLSVLFGIFWTKLIIKIFKKGLIPEHLKFVAILVNVTLTFSLSEILQQGSGVMVSTVSGIVFGNSNLSIVGELKKFKESITLLFISFVFLALASELQHVSFDLKFIAVSLALFLVFVLIRFLVVFISMARSDLSYKEKTLISWCAPRGIVAASMAALLAHRLEVMGVENYGLVEQFTFVMIMATVALYAITLAPLAKKLGLTLPPGDGVLLVGGSIWSEELAGTLKEAGINVKISDSHYQNLSHARSSGVKTHFGDVIFDVEYDLLSVSEFSTLLALSGNEYFNALVCKHFVEIFGGENVYQLAVQKDSYDNAAKQLPQHLSGHYLYDNNATFNNFMNLYLKGYRFKRSYLSEGFSGEELLENHPQAMFLFYIDGEKNFYVLSSRDEVKEYVSGAIILFEQIQSSD